MQHQIMMAAKLQLQLKKCTTTSCRRIKYNVEFLNGKKTTKEFQLALSSRCQALQDMTEEEDKCTLDSMATRQGGVDKDVRRTTRT